jgi:DNA repair exonuclease SbcCD ATPase subunit
MQSAEQDKQLHAEDAEKEIESLKQSHSELLDKLENVASQNDARVEQLEQSKTELQKALIDAQKMNASLKQEFKDKQDVESELEAQKQKAQSIESELELQKQEAEAAKQALGEAQKTEASLQEKITQLETQSKESIQASSKASSTAAAYPKRADIEELPTPPDPTAFFDLNYFWASQEEGVTLTSSLQDLLARVEEVIEKGERAVDSEKVGELIMTSQALMKLSRSINAEPLVDLAQSLENDCRQGLLDNALIRWYPTKQGLQKTLRVVYNQIHRI